MNTFINFEELKEMVSIEQAIKYLELDMTQKGNQLRSECPVCGGGERTLVVTPTKGVFYCFAAKKGGDQIALVSHVQEIGMKDAAHFLAEQYSTVQDSSSTVPKAEAGKETEKFQPLSYLQSDHEAVVAVGFDCEPELLEELGIGYATKGTKRGEVLVPIRGEDGTLIDYISVSEVSITSKFGSRLKPSNVVQLKRKKTA
jgi:DNA primase